MQAVMLVFVLYATVHDCYNVVPNIYDCQRNWGQVKVPVAVLLTIPLNETHLCKQVPAILGQTGHA